MNPLIQCKTTIRPLLIAGVLACFGLLSKAEAVVPAPDGGYPGGNTAEGQNALLSLTTGGFNTALGWFSLWSLTTGSYNTGVGAGTLVLNTGDSNTAVGTGALLLNTTGHRNTAIGFGALFVNNTGGDNTANGVNALGNNTTGASNTATGRNALLDNATGGDNTANGDSALFSNTEGNSNTAVGTGALVNNTTGFNNTALGSQAGGNVSTANNVIAIGTDGANVSDSCFIGNIFGATASSGTAVFINSSGQLGTVTSSRRFKKEIKPMDQASEFIHALKPVTFHYKNDATGTPQFGLIAEEVAEVNPDLVVRDETGKAYSVRYEQINAMLLNEFLKEHKKVDEQQAAMWQLRFKDAKQEARISELKTELGVLTAELKEQATQIQRVSARIEKNDLSPHVVTSR
ncbi:MAG TPA: tail fiber domain-containing protein [Candidatus Udaeobacter sp.]|nr:tail fiber domain-containing protein [Candidatus Udaeobacter sp.]